MNKKQLIAAWVIIFCWTNVALAYIDNYPPHKFKDGSYKHLKATELAGPKKSGYKSKDGKITVVFEGPQDEGYLYYLMLRDGETILIDEKYITTPFPYAVYMADLDKNGLQDFIVISNYRGCGLAAYNDKVDIFLKRADGSYQKITYDTMGAELGDFVDLNKDGKYEVIITDIYRGQKHNYFTYSIYEFHDYKLVNSDNKNTGFPKFVWMTDKPNDKDTLHLTQEEKQKHIEEKNKSIVYETIE